MIRSWSLLLKLQRDLCSNGGGLLLHIREDIPSRLLTEYKPLENVECLFVEINIKKKKWRVCWSYNPYQNNISNYLHHLKKSLDVYLKNCDNLLILGDLKTSNYLELDKELAKINLHNAELAEFHNKFLSVNLLP